ncbi:hypothetical protein IV203_013720 [Nitzschia inconspicua]|uniref:Uncharacterized protein n=1 Tax=Nitzschia inconspicua TaxID=303405 RepID=A0A9K3M795_9STRA|nr:hypothetical protein IV203_013720 [Nitzschia inconspicua]
MTTITRQRWISSLCILGVVVILTVANGSTSSIVSSDRSVLSSQIRSDEYNTIHHMPTRLAELGWMDTVEYYRNAVVEASQLLEMQNEANEKAIAKSKGKLWNELTDYEKYTVDISPLYDVVVEAVDTIGVKGLVFDVFTPELNEWYDLEEDDACMGSENHGYNCAHYGMWWFYHYVGSILGEKLVQDGRLLWDPMTGEESTDFFDLQDKIHEREELPFAWEMSFHVQHGLLWYYALHYMPDMMEFPTQLVHDFCGRWVHDSTVLENGKQIGFSCVHGFGHMVFNVVANRQIDPLREHPLNARRQVKPNSGFELNHESLCQIQKICAAAKEQGEAWEHDAEANKAEYVTNVGNRCEGGAIHSMKLMAATLPTKSLNAQKRKELARHFREEQEICASEDGRGTQDTGTMHQHQLPVDYDIASAGDDTVEASGIELESHQGK